jgi:hypothetical protein
MTVIHPPEIYCKNINKSITITKIKQKFQQSQTLDFIVIREITPLITDYNRKKT